MALATGELGSSKDAKQSNQCKTTHFSLEDLNFDFGSTRPFRKLRPSIPSRNHERLMVNITGTDYKFDTFYLEKANNKNIL